MASIFGPTSLSLPSLGNFPMCPWHFRPYKPKISSLDITLTCPTASNFGPTSLKFSSLGNFFHARRHQISALLAYNYRLSVIPYMPGGIKFRPYQPTNCILIILTVCPMAFNSALQAKIHHLLIILTFNSNAQSG